MGTHAISHVVDSHSQHRWLAVVFVPVAQAASRVAKDVDGCRSATPA